MIYKLDVQRSALVVIDVQNEYFDSSRPLYIPEAHAALGMINRAIDAFRSAGGRIIQVRHAHRADGTDAGRMGDFSPDAVFVEETPFVDFAKELRIAPSDLIVTKRRYSAFEGTELEALLRGNGVDTVVVAGFMTQFCCVSTARSAHDRDYRVLALSDAMAAPDMLDAGLGVFDRNTVHRVTLTSLGNGIAEVITTDEFCSRIGA